MNKLHNIILALILLLFGIAANADENKVPVRFIYINGANNNTPRMQKWFFNGINKCHPTMKKTLESSDFLKEKMLHGGQYTIEEVPGVFFWGDKSISDLENVDERLILLNMISPKMAQAFRSFFAHCIHDAIWVQKDHNMQPIVKDLHKEIITAYNRGEKVVLWGYSAGSFITFEYLFYKIPAISNYNLIKMVDFTEKQKEYVSQNQIDNTCIDALISSDLLIYSTNGTLIPTSDFGKFREIYGKLNDYTKKLCTPDNTLIGIINYASPIVLFYSDNRDPSIEINKYNQYIYEYLIYNNMFTITVNFADDPLGFPLTKNLTMDDLAEMYSFDFKDEGKGFMYDKSDVKSPSTFLGAHTSYWKHSKRFSKAVRDAYIEGYTNFYKNEK